MKTRFRLIVLILVSLLLFSHPFALTHASAEFTTSYNVTYEVIDNGTLWVSQEISLTNKFSNIYATQYSFILERGHPQNITASDQTGPVEVTTEVDGEKTTINLHFNQQVVGKDKTLKFYLRYQAPDLIRRSGQVWEVTLPKINNAEEIDSYNATLKIPLSLGKPAYISPVPGSQKTEGSSQFFYFAKEDVSKSGISAAFGEFQTFDFSLTYHLTNPTINLVETVIAWPPDTNYQKVVYQEIIPQPENVEVDEDGNWLGVYRLKPKEEIEVLAQGKAKIFAKPQFADHHFSLEKDKLSLFLKPQKYWEVTDPEIINIARKLKTPQAIFDFVVKTLGYDYSRVREGTKRLGASEALKTPDRAICTEFTDLFIAIARAAGIPARELNGYAYTNNPILQPLSLAQDILHSWPEYWDEKQNSWIQVDPTWQNTTGGVDYFSKLDLGHFVFAIHGIDSQFPPPAGAYKKKGQPEKNVQISFGVYQEPTPAKVKTDLLFPKQIIAEAPTKGKIKISNIGTEALYDLRVTIETDKLHLASENNFVLDVLPPFASREIPIRLGRQKLFSSGEGKIIVLVNDQKFDYSLSYKTMALGYFLPLFVGIFIIIVVLIIARKLIDLAFKKR